jgi:hypothetical protein
VNTAVTGVVKDSAVSTLQANILTEVVNPLLSVVTAFAFAWFIYGGVRFLLLKDKGGEEMERGKKHLIFGTIGLFIILSLWGILGFLADATGSNVWFK